MKTVAAVEAKNRFSELLAAQQTLRLEPLLAFAVLVGSRATGTAHAASDWDIALQWSPALDGLTNLAIRASVAEEGVPLTGQESLAWPQFLQRTGRELEDFYWDKQHSA